jgi:transcriptional regulator with XRE-family HTH domain
MDGARNEFLISAFARVLRDSRKQLGISQEEFAKRAGLGRTYIRVLETGTRQPTLCVIYAIAGVLHEKPEQLMARVGQAFSQVIIQSGE